ncbi:methyltransferase domain-containing protein [Actinomadura graeca]|uniref:Protein-L-isoaspartate O-methyltransferase n=1 Tax=Actinomadura graeca TaxID=2750812 RepID=A0ABX8QRW2_9ACTN|nr:methyltransferase domain-containing protein [Actinomadura graeca]QXJ21554.1 methyltransferase domain-containing protein [Actinomadura graeca]
MNRRQFIPDTVWVRSADGWMIPLHREDDPEGWARLCDSDDPIVTQVDDGAAEMGAQPTSSSSAPSIMRHMIDALDLEPGMRVLEIGTGTGYNAAMLARITGARNVTTIEVDPEIADHAGRALEKAGFPVTVITGDGALGSPENALYDRVIVTASVRDVPYAWVAQSVTHARILMPWGSDLYSGGVLLPLTVLADGTATGRFTRPVSFMRLREQRPRHVPWLDDERDGDYTQSTASEFPHEVFTPGSDARFAVGAALPGVTDGRTRNRDGGETYRLSHHLTGSWAAFTPSSGEHVVRQHGPRRLWDELQQAHAWWLYAGKPKPTRFGLTVTPETQTIWLNSPDTPVP